MGCGPSTRIEPAVIQSINLDKGGIISQKAKSPSLHGRNEPAAEVQNQPQVGVRDQALLPSILVKTSGEQHQGSQIVVQNMMADSNGPSPRIVKLNGVSHHGNNTGSIFKPNETVVNTSTNAGIASQKNQVLEGLPIQKVRKSNSGKIRHSPSIIVVRPSEDDQRDSPIGTLKQDELRNTGEPLRKSERPKMDSLVPKVEPVPGHASPSLSARSLASANAKSHRSQKNILSNLDALAENGSCRNSAKKLSHFSKTPIARTPTAQKLLRQHKVGKGRKDSMEVSHAPLTFQLYAGQPLKGTLQSEKGKGVGFFPEIKVQDRGSLNSLPKQRGLDTIRERIYSGKKGTDHKAIIIRPIVANRLDIDNLISPAAEDAHKQLHTSEANRDSKHFDLQPANISEFPKGSRRSIHKPMKSATPQVQADGGGSFEMNRRDNENGELSPKRAETNFRVSPDLLNPRKKSSFVVSQKSQRGPSESEIRQDSLSNHRGKASNEVDGKSINYSLRPQSSKFTMVRSQGHLGKDISIDDRDSKDPSFSKIEDKIKDSLNDSQDDLSHMNLGNQSEKHPAIKRIDDSFENDKSQLQILVGMQQPQTNLHMNSQQPAHLLAHLHQSPKEVQSSRIQPPNRSRSSFIPAKE